jgi:precorrin-6B methylase 2
MSEVNLELIDQPSLNALKHIDTKFDFIYIDGSHVAKDVITDACMCVAHALGGRGDVL